MEKTHQEVVDLTFDNFFGTTSLLCIILSVSGVFGFFNYLATESIPDEEMEHVQFLLKATVCLAIVLAVLKFVSQQLKDFFNKTEDSKDKFPMFDRLNLIFGYSGIVSLTFIFFAHLWVLDLTSSTVSRYDVATINIFYFRSLHYTDFSGTFSSACFVTFL